MSARREPAPGTERSATWSYATSGGTGAPAGRAVPEVTEPGDHADADDDVTELSVTVAFRFTSRPRRRRR